MTGTVPGPALAPVPGPAALLAGLLLLVGCGGLGLDPEEVVGVNGSYEAVTFRIEEGGTVEDVLEQNGILEVELVVEESRTSGRLLVPGRGEGGADLDVDLEGTWNFDPVSTSVRFDFETDVFLEQLAFLATPRQLEANQTLSGVRYLIVLRQTEG